MPLPLSIHLSPTFTSSFHPYLHSIQFDITVISVSVPVSESISLSFITTNVAIKFLLGIWIKNIPWQSSKMFSFSHSVPFMQLCFWHDWNPTLPKQSVSQFNSIFFFETKCLSSILPSIFYHKCFLCLSCLLFHTFSVSFLAKPRSSLICAITLKNPYKQPYTHKHTLSQWKMHIIRAERGRPIKSELMNMSDN